MAQHTYELPLDVIATKQPITINAGQTSFQFSKITWTKYKELTTGMDIKTTDDTIKYLEKSVDIMKSHLTGATSRPVAEGQQPETYSIEQAKEKFNALLSSVTLEGIDKLVQYFFQVTSDGKGQGQVEK